MVQAINNKGFSLIEIIISIAIFGIVSSVLIVFVTGSFSTLTQGGEYTQAVAYAQEGLEAIRSIRDRSWNELKYSPAIVSYNSSQWELSSGTSQLIDGKYTRTIELQDVCRDENDLIANCPAIYTDPNTKKILVSISWLSRNVANNTITQETYLTNWEAAEWVQTDWSGGSGQSIWSATNRYSSSDGNEDYNAVAGQLSLRQSSLGTWENSDRKEFLHTSDTDFNSGTKNKVVVEGTGDSASLVLDTELVWSTDSQSGVVTNKHLEAVYAITETDVWAGGNNGEMLHYDGVTWTTDTLPSAGHVRTINAFSSSSVWVAGHGGKIWHYNGSSWSLNDDTGNQEWNGLTMLSETEGWVGGTRGDLGYYDGSSWTIISIGSADDIYDIHAITSNDIWAVGASGKIWHYNGSSWSLHSTIGSNDWNDIVMNSATEGWVVGDSGTSAYYDGVSWQAISLNTTADVLGVAILRSDSIWAVGNNGRIWKYDGSSWILHSNNGGDHLSAITIDSSLYMWAVGNNGYILKGLGNYLSSGTFESSVIDSTILASSWDDVTATINIPSGASVDIETRTGATATPDETWSAWVSDTSGNASLSPDNQYLQYRITLTRGSSTIETPQLDDIRFITNVTTLQNLTAISAADANNVWAVTDNGDIITFQSSQWQIDSQFSGVSFNDITIAATNLGWAVGDSGQIATLGTGGWTQSTIINPADINGIYDLTNNEVWAVGADGKIWYFNGTSWGLLTDTGNEIWNDIVMFDEDSGVAIGNNGAIATLADETWTISTIPNSDNINRLYAVSSNDIWAVGDNGKIWHFAGGWSLVTDTGSQNWKDIYMSSGSSGWTVSDTGEIYVWDGATWTAATSSTQRGLYGVVTTSGGNDAAAWAVGELGEIIKIPPGGLYEETASVTSSAFLMGTSASPHTIEWDEQIPQCTPQCNITFQIRVADDSGGVPGTWSEWYGPLGIGTAFDSGDGDLIPAELNDSDWIQYKADLEGDGSDTPILNEIRIKYR